MNILYLTMNPNRQSTTEPLETWIPHLAKEGFSPFLVSRDRGEFAEWFESHGYEVRIDPLPTPSARNIYTVCKSILRLRSFIKRFKIDIIHCNEQDIYWIGCAAARICRIPVVVSIHFTMGKGFCEWAFGGKRCPDRIFFTSEGNLNSCLPSIKDVVPRKKYQVLYNGVDVQRLRPNEEQREKFRASIGVSSSVVLGVACALRPRKQLEHLFQVASRLSEENIKIVLAGQAIKEDEAYAEQLLAYGKSLLGEKLIFLGQLAKRDWGSFYQSLDVFVNTSSEEACSMSVIQSLTHGCPVLGYPSKSVDSQILPLGGEIVPQDDTASLESTLASWIADEKLLHARRSGARQQALNKFDSVRISKVLLEQYLNLITTHER